MTEKVFIAEDNESIRKLLTFKLTKEGFEVSTASDGAEAIDVVRKGTFDAYIIDIMLPKRDGWQTCHELRKEQKSDAPIIMITAKTDDMSKKVSEKIYHVDKYITKPFNPSDVVNTVRELIAARQAAGKKQKTKR